VLTKVPSGHGLLVSTDYAHVIRVLTNVPSGHGLLVSTDYAHVISADQSAIWSWSAGIN
jgi:hypothetical protein